MNVFIKELDRNEILNIMKQYTFSIFLPLKERH